MLLTVANIKGGVGKTTLATALACYAIEQGKRVIILDTDDQASSVGWYKSRANKNIHVESVNMDNLENIVHGYRDHMDLIVIDTPPHLGEIVSTAAKLSDSMLIPIQPSPHDLRAAVHTCNLIRELPHLRAGFVLNSVTGSTRLVDHALVALQAFRLPVSDVVIHRRVPHVYSAAVGQTATEYAPSSDAAQEIRQLWDWSLKTLWSA